MGRQRPKLEVVATEIEAKAPETAETELSEIEVDVDESRVADEAEAALAAEPLLFHRGGQLVRIVVEAASDKVLVRSPLTPRIVAVTAANLREMLTRRARFHRDGRRVHPPEWLVRSLLERGEWGDVARIRGVVDAPVLRADGTITPRPQYDDATELYLWPSSRFPRWPDSPTREDAAKARDALLEVFCDFPFERDAHRAAVVAAVLTLFARHAFEGSVPLFAIDKNTRGAGGTLLADAVGMLATGRPMPRMVAAKDAEEERKRIVSIALDGDPIVLIDNVAGKLGTDALDAALTGTSISDRLLGTNRRVTVPLSVTWFATGNNIEFGADTLRRVCHVRLASPNERPEERTGFRHPRLLDWIREERPRLVVAALTLLRAYCVAGRPEMGLKPWGSFEAWSSLVRNAVAWVGLEDPGKTREELTQTADSERNALGDLLLGWREMFGDAGGTIAGALASLEKDKKEVIPKHEQLASAVAELAPSPPGKPTSGLTLGKRLQHARGRVIGGLALDRRSGSSSAGVVWVVRQVSGVGGVSGDETTPRGGIQDPGSGLSITTNTTNTTRPMRVRTASGR